MSAPRSQDARLELVHAALRRIERDLVAGSVGRRSRLITRLSLRAPGHLGDRLFAWGIRFDHGPRGADVGPALRGYTLRRVLFDRGPAPRAAEHPCPVCGGKGWHTAGGNDPMECGRCQ